MSTSMIPFAYGTFTITSTQETFIHHFPEIKNKTKTTNQFNGSIINSTLLYFPPENELCSENMINKNLFLHVF